jgi:hypothetical protein
MRFETECRTMKGARRWLDRARSADNGRLQRAVRACQSLPFLRAEYGQFSCSAPAARAAPRPVGARSIARSKARHASVDRTPCATGGCSLGLASFRLAPQAMLGRCRGAVDAYSWPSKPHTDSAFPPSAMNRVIRCPAAPDANVIVRRVQQHAVRAAASEGRSERHTRHHRRGGEQVHSNASDTALARHARPVADASDVAGCDGVSAGWARDARPDDGPDRKPRCDESISSKTLCNAGVSGLGQAARGCRDAPDELCLAARSAGCVRAGRAGVDSRAHELSLQEGTQVLPELCSRSTQPV